MTDVVARIKVNNKHFEIMVDVDKALAFKKSGEGSSADFLSVDTIFSDHKKGENASSSDMQEAFNTTDVSEIAEQIVKKGEVQVPLEYKRQELGERAKQVVEFLVRNAVDPRSDRPYTPDRIESAMSEAGVNVTNKPIEVQINDIISKLTSIIPIKVETKKIKLTIPAQYTGQAYGLVQSYKESEDWKDSGDLEVVVNIPVGFQMDFYDKLNSLAHGSVLSEEIKEEKEE